MTLLMPAADRVVREAVDAVLDGRRRPGAGSDISFATRSSRYRVIHGVLREATDSSLIGARFIGWLFDGGREPKVSDRWDSDARAVLLDEPKGQIIVSSLTRVHVENALPPEALELPSTQLDGGFPQRAGTLHGMAAIDPEPSGAPVPAGDAAASEGAATEPARVVPSSPPEAAVATPPTAPAPMGPPVAPPPGPPPPAPPQPGPPGASQAGSQLGPQGGPMQGGPMQPGSLAQPGSPMPKRTIPPAPPIPGRQQTPVPQGSGASVRLPTPPHPGTRTAPMSAMAPPPPVPQLATASQAPTPSVPQATPSTGGPPGPPPRMNTPRTYFGLGPATQVPPAPPKAAGVSVPSDAPLPQFDLDDMDIPTRNDPMPPAPPSEEGDVAIPLIPRSQD